MAGNYMYMILIVVCLIYGVILFMKRGIVLYKMSYDYRRFHVIWLVILNIIFKVIHYFDRCDDLDSFNIADLRSLGIETDFCRSLFVDSVISIGVLILLVTFSLIIDYLTFGVINENGIYLNRFVKYNKIKSYKVDEEYTYIEIVYVSIFNKTRCRYLKMEEHELNKVALILSDYINKID